MPLIIRQFRDGDAPALWRVFHAAIHETAAADYTNEQLDAWAPDGVDESKWLERMRGIHPFVAERDGRVLGYADVQDDGYIDHFFVAPDAARQGVGSLLMEKLHAIARARGTNLLYAAVSETARPFFEKWGFQVDAAQTVTIRGVELRNYRMSKNDLEA